MLSASHCGLGKSTADPSHHFAGSAASGGDRRLLPSAIPFQSLQAVTRRRVAFFTGSAGRPAPACALVRPVSKVSASFEPANREDQEPFHGLRDGRWHWGCAITWCKPT